MKTLEMYDAELKALDLLIAKSQALIDARDEAALAPVPCAVCADRGFTGWLYGNETKCHACVWHGSSADAIAYPLESRPLAFGLPISHTDGWEHLGAYVLTSAAILPGDSRWSKGGVR